jgi:hypothetical protein
MSNGGSGMRPGGLTALAVLNFVFGGIRAIGTLFLIAAIGHAASKTPEGVDFKADAPALMGWITILLMLATTVLLIVSGIGYLKQKKFMGRTLGNLYAICSLATSGIALASGQNMMWEMIFAIYPLLTLLLINTTFKEDFVY